MMEVRSDAANCFVPDGRSFSYKCRIFFDRPKLALRAETKIRAESHCG